MEVAVTTDVGTAQRHNDDSWCAEQLHRNVTLLAVADGFGRPEGAPAAVIILDTVREIVRRELRRSVPPRSLTGADVRELLIEAFARANERLLRMSGSGQDHVSAACACTAVLIVSSQAFIAHIGDSRAYLYRRGELVQLTSDESILPELVTSRGGNPQPARYRAVRPLLTRALGLDDDAAAPKVTHYTLHPHDAVLFCTDGAYRALSSGDLQNALHSREQRAERATDRIITLTRAAGSTDNATALLARDATEHGAAAEGKEEPPRLWQPPLAAAFAALTAALMLGISLMWTADTKLYLGSDPVGTVTLYSGAPASVLGVPLHIARTTYGIPAKSLPAALRTQLDAGIAVASPAAARALVSQWQAKPQH